MRKFITESDGLPKWHSPISHAVVVNDFCYLSGQLSIDSAGKYIAGSAYEEAGRAFGNLFSALAAAGFQRSELVFVDVALVDIEDIGSINRVYDELFPEGKKPARTVYQAAALPFGGRVKVMGVAIRDAASSRKE